MKILEQIKALPKAEQHIHIVGSTRPETLLWLVEEGSIDAPYGTLEEVQAFFHYTDFEHFIRVYSSVVDCITKETQFDRITYEMLEDESKCNVQDVEASFSAPDHVLLDLDYGEMLNAINRGIRRARSNFGIACRLKIDLVRNYGPKYGMEVLDWIEEKGDNVVAIDIGGSEVGYPPEPYREVYKRARQMGLHLVAHAGEVAGPDSVWGALRCLEVERVGHGLASIEDPILMDYLADNEVTVESCPVSNVRTGAVPSVAEHPLREFLEGGIRTTVNSDDPSMFDTDMNNEYIQLHKHLGFTVAELFQLSLNAVDSAFLPKEERRSLRTSFIKEYRRIAELY